MQGLEKLVESRGYYLNVDLTWCGDARCIFADFKNNIVLEKIIKQKQVKELTIKKLYRILLYSLKLKVSLRIRVRIKKLTVLGVMLH